ncbi:NAD(P)-dependent oxidoreductase [Streptomyces sp. NPDC001811]
MTTISFIGLGTMGAPMALNLLRSGFDVVGYNRSPARVAEFVAAGGRGAPSVAEAVTDSDVVITMLPDSPDVTSVYTGPDGVIANTRPGSLLIDMSTIRPDVVRAVADTAAGRGLRFLDAPVSGGEQGAKDGSLAIMVGSSEADFAAALPVLSEVGATIVHVGRVGSGQTVKAANQLIVAGTIQLVAEALTFLRAHGVEVEKALEVIGGGLAGSAVLRSKGPSMRARDFTPGFRVSLHHKDLGIFNDAAREAGVVAPLAANVSYLVGALKAQGCGHLDHSALLLLVEQLSGIDAREVGTETTGVMSS